MDTRFARSAYRFFMFWGVLSSFVITVCTIVDALLIGNLVGRDGLAVTNLCTPVYLMFAMFGLTVGIGASVRIGRLLGASEVGEANRVFHSLLFLGLMIGCLCWVTLLFRDRFFSILGVTEELYPLARQYLTVVLFAAPMFVLYHILSVSVRTDSDPRLVAIASLVVIFVNLSLDLVFMLGFHWGIIGASASLCIAETMGVFTLLLHFAKKRVLLRLSLKLPSWKEIGSFVANGFGIGSAYIFQAIVMLTFNRLLIRYGQSNATLFVAIYGVLYSISVIPFAIFDGASNALTTITAFFFGEGDRKSIGTALRYALIVSLLFGSLLTAFNLLFAESLASFFGLSEGISNEFAATAIRMFSYSIVLTGINTILTAFWQAIGRPWLAGTMSALRNCVLLLLLGLPLIIRMQILGLSTAYIWGEFLCCLFALAVLVFSPSKRYLQKVCTTDGRVFENQYIIHTDSMERISGDLERICEEWEIAPKTTFFINFICEELLLNIIKFGLSEAKREYYISIRLMEKSDGTYMLRIRDNVNTFNPFETEGDDIDNGVLDLIRMKARRYDYQRKMIFNYLYMVI